MQAAALSVIEQPTEGVIIPKEGEPTGMSMSCIGSNCTATLTDIGTGLVDLPV